MSTRVDAEQVETTRSEKVLAVVLAIFLLVGAVWAYEKVDEIGDESGGPPSGTLLSPQERQAIAEVRTAQGRQFSARRQRDRALAALEPIREQYRTALEAGTADPSLEAAYLDAQARYDASEEALAASQAELSVARAEAGPAAESLKAAQRTRADEREKHDREVFLIRLALVALLLAASYAVLHRMRAVRSRYLPLGLAAVCASAALAIWMALDYGFDTVEFEEVGPLAISLIGIALTTLAFVGLQRYVARRVPQWRVRRGDCPFCGYPARQGEHCEGCGRAVLAPCAKCSAPRRVGSPYCGACGAA